MGRLDREDDVRGSRKAGSYDDGYRLKIPNDKTPWYILGLDYEDGFVHWVPISRNRKERVPCACDPVKDRGFNPETCKICEHMLELYDEAKRVGGKEGDEIKNFANSMRSQYEAHLFAMRGVKVYEKDRKTGKRVLTYDFDIEAEEDPAVIGKLQLSSSQFTGLTDMIHDNEHYPFIKDGNDLTNRVLWTIKRSKKGRNDEQFTKVEWDAEKEISEPPEYEIPEDLTIEDDFTIDEETLEKVLELLSNGGPVDSGDADEGDEEVELESDSDDSDLDENFLDDTDSDEDDDEEIDVTMEDDDDDDQSEDDDDDFEDDPLPEDKPMKKPVGNSSHNKKSTNSNRESSRKTSNNSGKSSNSRSNSRSSSNNKKTGTGKTGRKASSGKASL